jgi:predicted nucleic acid-binding protein
VIFVDTSFWVALRNRRDNRHQAAAGLLIRQSGSHLVTTNHVRGETWTFLRRRGGHRAAVSFLEVLDRSPRVRIEHVSIEIEERALGWLRQQGEREHSFVDATSFALMRTLQIREALAFDGDFSAAGFIELR